MKEQKISKLGCFPKAVFLSAAVWLFVFGIYAILSGPQINFAENTVLIVSLVMFGFFVALWAWSIFSLIKTRKKDKFEPVGVYRFMHHPMYSAIIFLLIPGLALLLKSWLMFFVFMPIFFIWRSLVQTEEEELAERYKEDYLKYKKHIWRFFPNLFWLNKPVFFAVTSFLIFSVTFVGLNLPSFYVRAVAWQQYKTQEKETKTDEAKTVVPTRQSQINSYGSLPMAQEIRPRAVYEKPNSIVIEKIKVDAPLVSSTGITQKEINAALNQGVLLYPGSVLPGEPGNVFLTGHSSSYPWNKTRYGQVFTLLDKLEAGDRFFVYFNKYKYEYKVTEKHVLPPDKVLLSKGQQTKTITLMTCWPIGTAWKRLVVEGVQIE